MTKLALPPLNPLLKLVTVTRFWNAGNTVLPKMSSLQGQSGQSGQRCYTVSSSPFVVRLVWRSVVLGKGVSAFKQLVSKHDA